MRGTVQERLDHCLPVRPDGECWIWTGTLNDAGYGVLGIDGKQKRAHRVAYETWVGPIPDGLTLDHVRARGCMSRACCNPAHLEPVTSGQNVLRGNGYAARNARKDTCVNGHEFTTDNTIQRPGGRGCRRCANAACVRHRKGNPDYRRRNRERNRRRVTCECGVETSAGNLAKHRRICRDSPEQE